MNVTKELGFIYIVDGVRFATREEAISYAKTLQDEKGQEKSRQDVKEKDEKR